jgi:integrase
VREPKPWYRKSNDSWYVEVGGKQLRLAKGKANRQEAVRKFHRLMAGVKPRKPNKRSVAEICDLFLIHSQRHHGADTFVWHRRYLQDFCDRFGRLKAARLIPFHLTSWLDDHPTWKASRRHATAVVKRAFSWAAKQKLLAADPLASITVEPGGVRDRILTVAEREQILAAINDQAFRDFVYALQETGCRPGEVARVTAADVNLDAGVWVLRVHKTVKKTREPRIVYLTDSMVELTRKLMAKFPDGPLFRGPRGNRPFSRNSIRCRFRRLREKLPHLKGVVAYSYRATYATDALVNGVGVAQVAELLGHKDTKMLMKHYAKLSKHIDHLRAMARKAIGGGCDGTPPPFRPSPPPPEATSGTHPGQTVQ